MVCRCRFRLASALLIACPLAAACGDDGGSASDTQPPATSTDSTGAPNTDDAPTTSPTTADPDSTGAEDADSSGSTTSTAGPITIVNVTPQQQEIGAPRDSEIAIVLEGSVDPSTVDNTTVAVFGRWSGVATGTFEVEPAGDVIRFAPDAPFFAGEWVTVTVSRGLTSASGEPLATGFQWGFWAQSNATPLTVTLIDQRSTRQPGEGWIQSYGAYAGDLDHDGDSDLMVPNEQANDFRVLLNDGSGNYPDMVVYPIPGASVPSTNEGGDFNMDGHTDFAIGSAGGTAVSVFMGAGDGTASHDANYGVGQSVRGLCVSDLDGDGDGDLISVSRTGGGDGDFAILLNDGTGIMTVTDTINPGGTGESSCAVGDANGDGIQDVFIGALQSDELFLYLGDGEGGLTLSDSVAAGGAWMLAAGDVDDDGNVDVVGADFGGDAMTVVRSDGSGNLLAPDSYPVGASPLAIDIADIDGDGDLDGVTSNLDGADYTLYENLGDGTFGNPQTLPSSSAGSCALLHDRDGDGDVDITAFDEFDDIIFFFDNPA